MIGLWIEAMTKEQYEKQKRWLMAYRAAEFDYYHIYDSDDMINFLASKYVELDDAGLMRYNTYPKELFDEGNTNTTDDNAEQKENTA